MEGVQNLRKAVYDFKLKVDATDAGSAKFNILMHQAINYLYRCELTKKSPCANSLSDGAIIVLANFLLETKEQGLAPDEVDFPEWLQQHREIRNVLSRKALD